MQREVACLIMLGPGGASGAERYVAGGRRAAAVDLCRRLTAAEGIASVTFLVADADDRARLETMPCEVVASREEDFHFGEALNVWVQEHPEQPLAYFGGGSAPLLSGDGIEEALNRLQAAEAPYAFVNNLHSTDWGLFRGLQRAREFLVRQTVDNGLGWGLKNECGFQVEAASVSAANRCDLDTPLDLVMIGDHPDVGQELSGFMRGWGAYDELFHRASLIRRLMATPASHLAVMGRSSSTVWAELERRTHVWVRMVAEERGMVASKRLERGQVRSVVGELAERMGPQEFIAWLGEALDGALWDTRVWMAARGGWPPRRERFAFDLGEVEHVSDPTLREWALAIREAPLPILAGGHGVVAGGILALLETGEAVDDGSTLADGMT